MGEGLASEGSGGAEELEIGRKREREGRVVMEAGNMQQCHLSNVLTSISSEC